MFAPKETLSKRGKRTLCKVYSKFFSQVRKKHYLILKVYLHFRVKSDCTEKKFAVSPSLYNIQKKKKEKTKTKQTNLILFRLLNELLAFTWHSAVLTGKAKYHSYIIVCRISSQDILFPI